MSAAETRKHLAYYRDNIANYEASLADTRARIAKLESKLAAEEAAEKAAAAAPRAPVIPTSVVAELWNRGFERRRFDALGFYERMDLGAFAAAIAAHVVAQGTPCWVTEKYGFPVIRPRSDKSAPEDYSQPAVLVYLNQEEHTKTET